MKSNFGKPRAWLVDVDGTLALRRNRDPYDWESAHLDAPNEPIVEMVRAINCHKQNDAIVVISGRHENARELTTQWLTIHGIPFAYLFMRTNGDYRPDEVIKEELFRLHIEPRFDVVGVVDDRDRVVRMWRRIGLTCLQVAPGDF